MRVLGLIPARSGSKTVQDKNIKHLNGKPLIAYTIEAALKSKFLSHTIVSTDSEKYAEIAKQFGADVPFIRPHSYSLDTTSDREVILHALEYFKNQQEAFDAVVYLRPTTPFKTAAMIDEGVALLRRESNVSGVRSVTRVEGVHHPYWMFKKEGDILKEFVPGIKIESFHQRQLLPPCFRLNGVVDILRTDNLRQFDSIYGDKIASIEIPEAWSVDIDTENDFMLADYLLSRGIS